MWKLILSGICLIGLIWIGDNSIAIRDSTLPPIGKFLSPSHGFWKNGDLTPPTEIDLEILDAKVRVVMDERDVPHIFADSYADALKVQGYLHAYNRLFQMDVSSRFTAGRLSEIFGERMLPVDKLMRRRGLPFAAENALDGWQLHKNSFKQITAYTEGVNAFIDQLSPRNYPLEYKLLSASIESWSPLKTALLFKSMSFDLSFRNEDDRATKSLESLGPDLYRFLFPHRSELEDPVIPPGTKWNSHIPEATGAKPKSFPKKLNKYDQELLPDESIGSNNWAVAGSRTKNGHPILCNDPHLRLRLPAIWYEVQLHAPDINVYGVSIPGVPGVVIGFNERIAWGMTNVGLDVVDWYEIKWEDESKSSYLLDGKYVETKKRIEEIKTKTGRVILDTVSYTYWGPVTYENDSAHYLQDYALRWLAHDKQSVDEYSTFFDLSTAANLDDYINAAKKFLSPAQNMVFASVDGDIALRVCGNIPVRSPEQGSFLQDGSSKKNDWRGFVDPDQNPITINPDRGFVSSANQISTDSTFPYPYHGYYADFRGRLLNKKLSGLRDITIEDMKSLQNDGESLLASELLPALLKTIENLDLLPKAIRSKIDKLQNWNMRFEANQIAPAYFLSWFDHFYELTWDEFIDQKEKYRMPEYWRTIDLLNNYPAHAFFDHKSTPELETATEIVNLALERMSNELDTLLEKDEHFNWGKYNSNVVSHLLNLPAFSSEMNPVDGFKYALNATSATHGPSWRMIVELSEPVQAWGIYPGGQSGHPGHTHYDDMIDDWTSGNYYKLHFYSSLDQADDEKNVLIEFK